MRGNCAEVGVAWARRSAGDTAGCDLSTLCILNWDTTGFKNQQLAADSQQTQMQEWKLEHQTEQPSPNKGDEVDAPLRSLAWWTLSNGPASLWYSILYTQPLNDCFLTPWIKSPIEAVYGWPTDIPARGCELSRHILCAICQTSGPLDAFGNGQMSSMPLANEPACCLQTGNDGTF